jgi:hypothetical protein
VQLCTIDGAPLGRDDETRASLDTIAADPALGPMQLRATMKSQGSLKIAAPSRV